MGMLQYLKMKANCNLVLGPTSTYALPHPFSISALIVHRSTVSATADRWLGAQFPKRSWDRSRPRTTGGRVQRKRRLHMQLPRREGLGRVDKMERAGMYYHLAKIIMCTHTHTHTHTFSSLYYMPQTLFGFGDCSITRRRYLFCLADKPVVPG